MKKTITNDKRYPSSTIEISNSYEKISADTFTIRDDKEWEDFINQLNQYREEWEDFINQLNQYREGIAEWLKLL